MKRSADKRGWLHHWAAAWARAEHLATGMACMCCTAAPPATVPRRPPPVLLVSQAGNINSTLLLGPAGKAGRGQFVLVLDCDMVSREEREGRAGEETCARVAAKRCLPRHAHLPPTPASYCRSFPPATWRPRWATFTSTRTAPGSSSTAAVFCKRPRRVAGPTGLPAHVRRALPSCFPAPPLGQPCPTCVPLCLPAGLLVRLVSVRGGASHCAWKLCRQCPAARGALHGCKVPLPTACLHRRNVSGHDVLGNADRMFYGWCLPRLSAVLMHPPPCSPTPSQIPLSAAPLLS